MVYGSDGSRHTADERTPASDSRRWLSRALARRRGPHRDSRQEGPERTQDARGVPCTARCRHFADANDDASRYAAALLASVGLWVAESDCAPATSRRHLDAGADAHPCGGFEAAG